MIELIALSLTIMLASLTGVLFVWGKAGRFVEQNLDYLVSFSAGVFLVFLYGLAGEAVEHAATPAWGVGWLLIGALGVWVTVKLLPSAHVHIHEPNGTHKRLDPRRLLITDSVHNVADGIFLAASFAISPVFALMAGLSVFLHEALQEISEFFVLRDAGYSTRRALAINFAVSSTILVGAIGGYFLLGLFEMLEGPLLGLAAGGILIVVLHDLIPHSVREAHTRAHYARHLLWFVLGTALMFAISFVGGH